MLHSGYSLELLVANIGPSATLSRLGGLRVLLRAETRQKIRVRLKLGTWDEQQQACESMKRRSRACPGRGEALALPTFGLCCAVTLAVVPLLGLMHMLRVFLREAATGLLFSSAYTAFVRDRTSSYGGSSTTHLWRWHAR